MHWNFVLRMEVEDQDLQYVKVNFPLHYCFSCLLGFTAVPVQSNDLQKRNILTINLFREHMRLITMFRFFTFLSMEKNLPRHKFKFKQIENIQLLILLFEGPLSCKGPNWPLHLNHILLF